MNKKLFILIPFLIISNIFYGQKGHNHEKIKSLKVAFITEKLDLSSAEAEAFWPIYNAQEKKENAIRKTERKELQLKGNDLSSLSEKDAEALLAKQMDLEKQKYLLQEEFVKKIKGILSAKKIMLLLKSEEDFKRKLIKQYRHKKGGGGGHR